MCRPRRKTASAPGVDVEEAPLFRFTAADCDVGVSKAPVSSVSTIMACGKSSVVLAPSRRRDQWFPSWPAGEIADGMRVGKLIGVREFRVIDSHVVDVYLFVDKSEAKAFN